MTNKPADMKNNHDEARELSVFLHYKKKQISEVRFYNEGEVLSDRVSISAADKENGSPKAGDMIARNPKNHDDQWLIAADYFKENFESASPPTEEVGKGEDAEFSKGYKCHDCGSALNDGEGSVFTICSDCWKIHFPPPVQGKSAEEILENDPGYFGLLWPPSVKHNVIQAMHEYANQFTQPEQKEGEDAIAFAEWIQRESIGWDNGWFRTVNQTHYLSTAELYQIWLRNRDKEKGGKS